MTDCNFTQHHYESCLSQAKKKGYEFFSLKEFPEGIKKDKVIFMRHDVDFDPRLALQLAKIEKKVGVKSTFFFRVNAPYNLFSIKNYQILKEIQSFGHEIGLHFDADFGQLFGESQEDMLIRSKQVVEGIIGEKVEGICPHEPSRSSTKLSDDMMKKLGFSYEAYSPSIMDKTKYISDSSCRWREGCMCNFIKKEVPKLYILTHPVWWFNRSPIENY